MPYASITDLPENLRGLLPRHAQEIYRSVFNSALEQYGEEERAAKVAWAAVKGKYRKDVKTGQWVQKFMAVSKGGLVKVSSQGGKKPVKWITVAGKRVPITIPQGGQEGENAISIKQVEDAIYDQIPLLRNPTTQKQAIQTISRLMEELEQRERLVSPRREGLI
jgi:cation transport regulator